MGDCCELTDEISGFFLRALMIHAELASAAKALNRTLVIAPDSLPQLMVSFAVGIELCRRELLMYLWCTE